MFDIKIAMILFPVWLATVGGTLYLGFTRPKAAKIVSALLSMGCDSPESAKTRTELGISAVWETVLLRPGGALRQLIDSPDGQTPMRSVTDSADGRTDRRYYISPEKQEKAQVLYGKKPVRLWQCILLALLLTVFFFVLLIVAGLVFDTSALKPLFEF